MCALVKYNGNNEFHGVSTFHPSKRVRAALSFSEKSVHEERKPISLDSLPNECLFEILRRLPGSGPRRASALVSKRWLTLLSTIRYSETQVNADVSSSDDVENEGYIIRRVIGRRATDVTLAALAIGTSGRGGLGKLFVCGNNPTRGVTDFGLLAIARWCPSLRVLSLTNVPTVGDKGLCEVAKECHLLERLELGHCPSVSDKGLTAIAQNSPLLKDLAIESSQNISNESLLVIAKHCPKLQCVTIKNSSTINHDGIVSLLLSLGSVLSVLNIQGLSLADFGLTVIGNRCYSKLSSLTIDSCSGITDSSLETIGKGCPNLQQVSLLKCCFVSDYGLVGFISNALSLNDLHLEEIDGITLFGLLFTLSFPKSKLFSLTVIKCLGITDIEMELPSLSPCISLHCLSIQNCPGFGNASLAMVGKLCPRVHDIDFTGLSGITDAGLLPLVESWLFLGEVNLEECIELTDDVVSAMAKVLWSTLQVLNLSGCYKVTDVSLFTIAKHAHELHELDVSKCCITDAGIAALASDEHMHLMFLSLSGCVMLSDQSLSSLSLLSRSLKGLNLQNCVSMSSRAVQNLEDTLRECDIMS